MDTQTRYSKLFYLSIHSRQQNEVLITATSVLNTLLSAPHRVQTGQCDGIWVYNIIPMSAG